MKIKVLTIFPEMVEPVLKTSILSRAIEQGILQVDVIDIRPYSTLKHKNTDDYPFGGGPGMVMLAQPIVDAIEDATKDGFAGKRLYLSPRGRTFDQKMAEELAAGGDLLLLCGHYEGVDQRVLDEIVDEELSIGDYVLTGGELGALVLVDCIGRMVEGVLPSEECFTEESHWNGLLEYPQYTHPVEWNGRRIPDILLSGDHGKIAKWRHEMSLRNTLLKRPDLLEKAELSQKDRWLVAQMKAEQAAKDGNDSNAAQTDGETDRK